MADDYYEGLEADEPATESGSQEGKTTLLEKSVFPGEVQPGQKITLEVVRVFDTQVEAKPTSKPQEKPEPSPDEEIDMMAQENEDEYGM